jgi:hypothetical protein
MSTLHPKRLIPLTPLLLIAIPVALAHHTQTEELTLTAYFGKPVFFEDEPIFYVLRLTNVGSDTAWVLGFGSNSMDVQMSVRRDGEAVPVGGVWVDYVCRNPVRCGAAFAPGSSRLTAGILQERAGDEQDFKRSDFLHHLGPGEYEVRVGMGGVEATPITFRIRERSATETRELKELGDIRSMVWTRGVPTNYEGALISWVMQHPQDDPFLPFLLARWLYGPPPGMIETVARQANLDLDSLRAAVLLADRSSPAAAYIAQSMEGWRPQQLAALADSLGASLAGEMAHSVAERLQRTKH